jgi:hypothetical protein
MSAYDPKRTRLASAYETGVSLSQPNVLSLGLFSWSQEAKEIAVTLEERKMTYLEQFANFTVPGKKGFLPRTLNTSFIAPLPGTKLAITTRKIVSTNIAFP